MQVRTIDFSRYKFRLPEAAASQSDVSASPGAAAAAATVLQPWQRALSAAAARTESLSPFDQGVRRILAAHEVAEAAAMKAPIGTTIDGR
jgi:hypothetical protein